eukprot:6345848-Amphidinium_carterae.1
MAIGTLVMRVKCGDAEQLIFLKAKIAVLIPSRYGSSRFPGKPCNAILNGVPMGRLVFEKCRASGLDSFLLSDDERVLQLVPEEQSDCRIMTSAKPTNGTERCAEAVRSNADNKLGKYEAFINVQGDMPDYNERDDYRDRAEYRSIVF